MIINFNLLGRTIKKIKVKGQTLNILSRKDLIEMKKIAGREQDLADIDALERLDEV